MASDPRALHAHVGEVAHASETITRSRRRRRPSGEPPPLPRRLNTSGRFWLVLIGAMAVFWVLVTATSTGDVVDLVDHGVLSRLTRLRNDDLTTAMRSVGLLATAGGLQVIWWVILLVLVVFRRWRHLFVSIGAMLTVSVLTEAATQWFQRARPYEIEILGDWNGFAMPSRPVAILAATCVIILYALVPQGRLRDRGKWVAAGLIALVAFSRLYLAQDGPSDVLCGAIIGVAIPLVFFRLLIPNDVFPVSYGRGRKAHLAMTPMRLDAIRHALEDQLGLIALEIKPFGLTGSGGSTPLRVRAKGDPDTYVFCKLYAITHVRSDRWYKLGRTLLYGRLEDEAAFQNVRRLVQYEDYALRLLWSAELPVPEPLGVVEITPEREYLLVMEFFDGAQEIGDVTVDDDVIDQGLMLIRRLWEAGLAHRDIKPANLLVRDGQLLVIDSAFAEVRPSPWRQAVDLANMMLVLALSSDVSRVYNRALNYFSVDEIAEAFAATRGLTMPSQLRRLMRAQGRDLHAEFRSLLPYQLPPIAIQRWSVRRVVLLIGILFGGLLAGLIAVNILTSPL
jgi:membrane-associated phospholipid phosphatase/tRNA A-37 threonylcarbamoyl transferase component Bud32